MSIKEKINLEKVPQHIAIIMDGNGRWAKKRALNRVLGHRAGVESIRESLKACREIGVKYLTVYAFSVENWNRPQLEIKALMGLLKEFLKKELKTFKENKIKLEVIGRIADLPKDVQAEIDFVKKETAHDYEMTLFLALSYGGRSEIIDAIKKMNRQVDLGDFNIADLTEENFSQFLYTGSIPDPDLLIRTSGEMRVSNFLLWQISYAEFYFTEVLWPEFTKESLFEAVVDFQKRKRRYGKIDEL